MAVFTAEKLKSWSADHTSSWLSGRSAAATGTSGKPIVGPHSPTTAGLVEMAGDFLAFDDEAAPTCRSPCKSISAAATYEPEPAAVDRAVSLTMRTVTGVKPICLTAASSAHVPVAIGAPK